MYIEFFRYKGYYIERIRCSWMFPRKAVNILERNYTDCVPVLKALADETRLEILYMLQSQELCACKIQEHFKISQPTLSYHMKILMVSGLVTGRKDGLWMQYSINNKNFEATRNLLDFYMNSANQESDCNCSEVKAYSSIITN